MSSLRAPRRPAFLYTASNHPDLRTMIGSLVNGVDITLIEPSLYPMINANLEVNILRFQDAKDQFAVDLLQFVQRYINDEYPQEVERDRLLTIKKKELPPKPQPFTKDELDEEISLIMMGDRSRQYSKVELDSIVEELKRRREEAIADEDYEAAENITMASNEMSRKSEIFDAVKIQEEKADELKEKLEEAKRNLTDLKERWRAVFENFESQRDRELQDMYVENMRQVDEIDKQKDGAMPAKFRKYSPLLLNMRRRERAMVSSKRYDEASVLQEEADRVQMVEDERNTREWHASIDDQAHKLAAKLNQALYVRQTNLEKEEQNMRRQMKAEVNSAEKQCSHLEKEVRQIEESSVFGEVDAPVEGDTKKAKTVRSREMTTRSSLPSLNLSLAPKNDVRSPKTFRQRAILNMKIYTKKPDRTPRRR